MPLSFEFSDLNFGSLKIVVSYSAVHLLREPNPLGLVIKALNGTAYLQDRNIRCNKIITSTQEEGTRPKLELVGLTWGKEGAAGRHSTLSTPHSEFKISLSETFLKTTSSFHSFQQLRLPAERQNTCLS